MSTRSIGRRSAASQNGCSAATQQNNRHAASHQQGRSGAPRKKQRPAASPSKDRSSLCTFTFADGRQCRTPRHSTHPNLCYFHARKEAQARAADQLGRDLSFYTSRHYLSACNLSSALARVFTAAAQGHIKTKTATALAYTAQVLVQTLQLAQHEYIEALGPGGWRKTIHSHITDNCDYINAQRSLTPQPSSSSSPQPAPPEPAPPSSTVSQPPPTHPPAPTANHSSPPATSVEAGLQFTLSSEGPGSSSSPAPPQNSIVPSASPAPMPSAPSPPPGIGTLGNWNPPTHSGSPRRARRGPGRHSNLCPSRLP